MQVLNCWNCRTWQHTPLWNFVQPIKSSCSPQQDSDETELASSQSTWVGIECAGADIDTTESNAVGQSLGTTLRAEPADTRGSSSESMCVKSCSKLAMMSSATSTRGRILLCGGPGFDASPTRTPRSPYRAFLTVKEPPHIDVWRRIGRSTLPSQRIGLDRCRQAAFLAYNLPIDLTPVPPKPPTWRLWPNPRIPKHS